MNAPETKYSFSKKGFDFEGKPLNFNSNLDHAFAMWGHRIFFIGEKKKDACDLYDVKDNKPVYAFTVKYKNIILAKTS